jgi:alpha-ribazole phosphatase
MADTLILVRHGEVEGSRAGRLLGSTDVPLSEEGRRQAAAAGGVLSDLSDAQVVCSPLARARETAGIIVAGRAGLEIDSDLREFDFGAWEGLTYAEVEKADPAGARAWSEFADSFVFPGGESLAGFSERIGRAARSFACRDMGTVVCVAHGGVIRALICRFLGLPLCDYLLFDITPGSVTTLRIWGERGVLAGLWRPHTIGKEAMG